MRTMLFCTTFEFTVAEIKINMKMSSKLFKIISILVPQVISKLQCENLIEQSTSLS